MEALYLVCGARRPQLKRNPLGTHDPRMSEPTRPSDIKAECDRTDVNLYEALRSYVSLRFAGRSVESGKPIMIDIPPTVFYEIMRTLPDHAGTTAFLDALLRRGDSHGPDSTPPAAGA